MLQPCDQCGGLAAVGKREPVLCWPCEKKAIAALPANRDAKIVALHAMGRSDVGIARAVGCHVQTVEEVLSRPASRFLAVLR